MPENIKKEHVLQALERVSDPELQRDVVSLQAVRKVNVCDGNVGVTLALASPDPAAQERVRTEARRAIHDTAQSLGYHVGEVEIAFAAPQPATTNPVGATDSGIPGVSRIIAVGAGKGGVGKSTIAVNLAVALARRGHAVGLMDGDIYGPSVPTLLGLGALDAHSVGNMLQPFAVHDIKAMTLGKLVDDDKPLIWRGPMAHGAFKQLVTQTAWGDLDYLIIDLPPGTGDVPLTMAQLLRLAGAVIVCTPQKVAQDDAVRAAAMFKQLNVNVLGVVENMSYFVGDDGKQYDLFGRGGAQQMAQRLSLPFLGAVPISMALRRNSDAGDPSANFDSDPANMALSDALESVAEQVENQVALAAMRPASTPTLTVS